MSLGFPIFRPHPLVRGGHLQTIVGCYLPTRVINRACEHLVPLPDGDTIVLHDDGPSYPRHAAGECSVAEAAWEPGDGVAVLLHGLGGCHQSGYMQRCSARLRARGIRVLRMDLRGCGAGFALARHPLHAGRSEDAAAVLAYVIEQFPDSPIHLVGFSMGANIVLKLAGELADQGPANLASVMAVSPPIDLVECSKNMQRGWNRVYDRRFVRNLIRHIRRRSQLVPSALSRPLHPPPRRLVDFDNVFTAPLSGFGSAEQYYEQASSGRLLPQIAVPTLIVTAANDPIIPVKPFEVASYSATTRLVITPCGGHLGFVAAPGIDPDVRWLDWRVVDWVVSRTKRAGSAMAKPAHSKLASAAPLAVPAAI